EMRNEVGPVAHGKDGFLDAIAADHARAFLHVGDVILGILLNAFDGKQPDLVATREPYENFPHLNERIDRAVAVAARVDDEGDRPMVVFSVASGPLGEAIELRVEPSRLLYGIDREAYVEVLKTVQLAIAEAEEGEEPKMDSSAAQIIESPASVVGTRQAPATELVGHYQGELADLQNGVEAFLLAEGMNAALTHDDGARLIDSLLATAEENLGLDWKEREAMQAKLDRKS